MKTIYFDMDGTLSNLYAVDDVFNKLDNWDCTPYKDALPINKNIELLKQYKHNGYRVVILSCLSKITNEQFDVDTIQCKNMWLDMYVGKQYIDERIYIPYTKHKEMYVHSNGILVDDDKVILSNWNKGSVIAA